jgi:hypothetical protein
MVTHRLPWSWNVGTSASYWDKTLLLLRKPLISPQRTWSHNHALMMQLPAHRPANFYVIYTRALLESQHVVAAVALVSAGSRKVVDENTACGMMRLDALS